MSTASTLRVLADAIEILDNPAPMPPASTIDWELIDAMVLLANAGTLEATIGVAKASTPTPARKAQPRKPKAVKVDATMRMTKAGRMMPTNVKASDKQVERITARFRPAQIRKQARKLGFAGQSLKTLNVADASDLLFTLKAAA